MSSTDDVELLGTVREDGVEEEEEDEGNVIRHPAGQSTTPFGKHHSKEGTPSSSPDEAPSAPPEAAGEGDLKEPSQSEAQSTPKESTSSEIDEALEALEAEVETALNPEAVEAIEKEAFNRGRAAAMAEMAEKMQAYKAENAALKDVSESISSLAGELEDLRVRLIQQASEDVADMALHMARRVVGETLAVHPQALRKLVVDAIERLPGDDEITVRVRPQDLQSIQDNLPVRRDIRVIEDDSLEGGCVVQAQCGEVSASIETAFTGLRAAVDEWLEDQK